MNVIDYLEAKYGEEGPRIVTTLEARAFGIKYPLQSGWLEKHGGQEITPEIASDLAAKLYEKGMRTGSESKANYCLVGAAILRKISAGGRP
jgi:hypothetical protein